MPKNKRQHFVPRCHLRPFSVRGEGAATNLYNFSADLLVPNASLKGQCARDYFYGSDLRIEQGLQVFEQQYARVLRDLQRLKHQPSEFDLWLLRRFAHLQYVRTEEAIRRIQLVHKGLEAAIGNGQPVPELGTDWSDTALIHDSMRIYLESQGLFDDLKTCIVRNASPVKFVTSDDPAVVTNRFHFQRLRSNNFGLSSSGTCLVLPLTPALLLLCYDGNVYTIDDLDGHFVQLQREDDARSFNELQFLKAARNVYFAEWSDKEAVRADCRASTPRRRESWFQISVLVKVGSDGHRDHYRPALPEEIATARETVVHAASLYPEPGRWFSKLRFRSKVKTYFNGTAIGHVRKKAWLSSDGIERDLARARHSTTTGENVARR